MIRRGTPSRDAIAVAAIASGGATMAPSAIATDHGMSGMSAWATTATVNAVAKTRPTASELIVPRLARKLRTGVKYAAI